LHGALLGLPLGLGELLLEVVDELLLFPDLEELLLLCLPPDL
jgi:hypothetical protein